MEKQIIVAIAVMGMVGLTTAATVEWDFNDNNAVVDVNSFGSGVTVSDWVIVNNEGWDYSASTHDGPTDGMARGAGRKDSHLPTFTMSFTVTVDAATTMDLTGIAWENGADTSTTGWTPLWDLAITAGGSATPSSGGLDSAISVAGFYFENESVVLSGLTGLTDTSVTFTWDLTQEDRANSLANIANTMDDVVLTGTASDYENPLPTINTFTASPSMVDSNGTVTLTWTTTNADSLSIDQGIGMVIGANSSTQIVVTADTIFSLIAVNGNGSTTSSVPVTINLYPPTIQSFTASPASVANYGDTVTLSWNVVDATSLTLDPGNVDVLEITSTEVVVNAATSYTLTATNPDGTVTQTTTVHKTPDLPNILLVIVDDMGTEDTSVDFNYDSTGNPVDRVDPVSLGFPAFSQDNRHFITPNTETLAANGMKFSSAYACQVCSPTRVTLMTGQNASRHGTIQYISGGGSLYNIQAPPNGELKRWHRTLAEVLRDAGYRTIVAGKGHMGNEFTVAAGNYKTPAADPYDDYYGFQINVSASTKGMQGSCYANASPAFKLATTGSSGSFVSEYQGMTYNQLDSATYPTGHAVANEPVFITEALGREMDERIADSVAAGKPFFAYMSEHVVHDPHQPDPRFTANYPGLSGDVLDFATMIEGMDQSLGDTLAKLEELGVAENTLVIFLGDNGSDSKPRGPQNPPILTMTNPLRGEKGNCYEGGIRVPLIFAWAKLDAGNAFQQALPITPGSREHDIVSVQDLYPTLLSIVGLPLPTTDDDGNPLVIDGADLKPYLLGTPGTHRPQTLITHAPCSSRSSFFTTYHDGDWKLIYGYTHETDNTGVNFPLGAYELYNLGNDMHEATDLAASNPDQVMRMARAMVAELERRGGGLYPILKAYDSDLDGIDMPSALGDRHPVILPASAVDIDADGLDDNTEDPNRNGLVDAGETDPDNDNTDGDGTPDGAEVRTGTDPLDPESDFVGEWVSEAAGGFTATWPSLPGAFYEIQTTDDLTDWSGLTIATDIPARDPGTTTSYTVPASGDPQRFYRIGLLP